MIDKLKKDKKYRAKIELAGYGIFILIALIFAVSGRKNIPENDFLSNYYSNIENNGKTTADNNIINLFDKYTYDMEVTINENIYKFNGEYNNSILTINKEDGSKYEYKDDNYYLIDTNEIITDNIYKPVDSKYLDINLINKYLSIAKYEDGKYKVYLKDIILVNDSTDYITINYTSNLNEINIDIDYTNLLKYFNDDIEKYLITMKYNKVID